MGKTKYNSFCSFCYLFGVKKKKQRFDMTLRIHHVLIMIILFDQQNL